MVGPASAFTAYVSNEKDNTLSVIDTSEWQVVKTIKVGQTPSAWLTLTVTSMICYATIVAFGLLRAVDLQSS